jgi:hypothetical protein
VTIKRVKIRKEPWKERRKRKHVEGRGVIGCCRIEAFMERRLQGWILESPVEINV